MSDGRTEALCNNEAVEGRGREGTIAADVEVDCVSEGEQAEWSRETVGIGRAHLVSVLTGAFCMLCSGTLYGFGAYSEDLKTLLGWTESQMEVVGYMGDFGVYLSGPITGAFQDIYGPRLSCSIAAALLLAGYGGMAACLAFGKGTSPVLFGPLLSLAGIGSGLLYVSSLSTNIEIFPENYRGKLVGLLVSLFGLSALVFTTVYRTLFQGDNALAFLAFMATACGGAALLGTGTFPLVLESVGCGRWEKSGSVAASRDFSSVLLKVKESFLMLVASRVFWLFFSIFFLISGNGLFVINNAASIAKSIDPEQGSNMKTSLVIALSACNWFGRLASGVISDSLTARRGVFFIVSSVMFAAAVIITLAVQSTEILYVFVMGVGLAYGVMWSILPTCISEVFGAENFGQNWGVSLLAPAAGGLLFNFIAGVAYDVHSGGSGSCTGWSCFHVSLVLALGSCAVACFLSIFSVPSTDRGRKEGFQELVQD